mgnify:CR=1 FL=1
MKGHPSAADFSASSCFGVSRWRSDPDRFERARQNFNFETLTFLPFAEDDACSVTATDLTSTFGGGANAFASKLSMEPSAQFVQRSARKVKRQEASKDDSQELSGFDRLAACDRLVGRDEEVEKLICWFQDSETRIVNLIGYSGSGKSVLAQQIKTHVEQSEGFLAAGKFDVQNRADPYEAFVQAMHSLISQVSQEPNSAEYKQVIQEVMGEDIQLLAEFVPAAKIFQVSTAQENMDLPEQSLSDRDVHRDALDSASQKSRPNGHMASDPSSHHGITERANRIQFIVAEFLRAVSRLAPVTFILDDIQWGGPAALSLLDSLLGQHSTSRVFFLTTCRAEYFEDPKRDVTLQQLLDKCKEQNILQQLTISGLSADLVQLIINDLLRMDPTAEKTKDLAAIVHQKTDGNPFFVLAFLQALVEEGLLRYDLTAFQWEWLEVDIQSHNVAENVAQAVTKQLDNLTPENLFVAQMASCISRSLEHSTLQFILSGLIVTLQDADPSGNWHLPYVEDLENILQCLVDKGILEVELGGNNCFVFSHDQIQQAVFQSIPLASQAPFQMAIGKRLIEGLDKHRRKQFLFRAVELCSVGLLLQTNTNAINNERQEIDKHFAFWAFLAGDEALKQGAFESALKFFEQGIFSLGSDPFKRDSELSLPLYSGAVEAAYCAKKGERVREYAMIVKQQPDVPQTKKMRVAHIEIKVHSGKNELRDAVQVFRDTVKSLGIGSIPENPTTLAVIYELTKARRRLKKLNRKALLSIPECQDPAYEAAAASFSAIIASLYFLNPNLFVICTCKAIQWSLDRGVTQYTPDAWNCMAMVLNSAFGDIDKAIELAESSLALCEDHSYKEALPNAFNLVYGFVRHWKKPMHQFESPMRYGIDLGIRCGKFDWVSNLMCNYTLMALITSAKPLPTLITEVKGFVSTSENHGHDELANHLRLMLQFALNVAADSSTKDLTTLTGEAMDEPKAREEAAEKDIVLTGMINWFKCHLLVYFGDAVEASKYGRLAKDFGITYAVSSSPTTNCTFIVGLAEVLAYKKTKKKQHMRNARAMRKRLAGWLSKGNPNVFHNLRLLEAEIASTKARKKIFAAKCYREAIAASSRIGYQMEFARANERFAVFQMEILGDVESARRSLGDAVKAYETFGATSVVRRLEESYPHILTSEAFESREIPVGL